MMARPVKRGHFPWRDAQPAPRRPRWRGMPARSIASFDVSVNLFVDSINANTKELYDRSDARWKEIKEAQKEKLALERERIQGAKLEAEAILIKAKNYAKSFELTKMVEESKILSMLLEGMDPLSTSWKTKIN
jgi:parvulin-like peptidyl-prolyl isomerase